MHKPTKSMYYIFLLIFISSFFLYSKDEDDLWGDVVKSDTVTKTTSKNKIVSTKKDLVPEKKITTKPEKNITSKKEPGKLPKDTLLKNYDVMVLMPKGSFIMGSKVSAGKKDEQPARSTPMHSFFIDKYEITQRQYMRLIKNDKVFFHKECPDCPADKISWIEALEYCKKLGKRLPTEKEWEYSARAGTQKTYYWNNDDMDNNYAWYYKNSDNKTHIAGTRKPNNIGLYDMLGNVFEWCSDWYQPGYAPTPDSTQDTVFKVIRGGSFGKNKVYLRVASRAKAVPKTGSPEIGFRCVKEIE